MRALWKGAVSFGLVNIPVRLYAATERKSVKFSYLHAECSTPIRYMKWCPACEREVAAPEIVRGYEYEKGRYVVLRDEDFERIPLKTTRTIDIVDFVNLGEIDPVYYDKTYFLEPADGGVKPYFLLHRVMENTGKIAIAKVIIRSRESLAAVRTYRDGTLVMETMFYPDEIRSAKELVGTREEVSLDPREIEMAENLVQNLSARFDPAKYTDKYREALLRVIHEKIKGAEVEEVAPVAETGKVVDLMEALRASLEVTRAERQREKALEGVSLNRP